jgi:hypothetical protein
MKPCTRLSRFASLATVAIVTSFLSTPVLDGQPSAPHAAVTQPPPKGEYLTALLTGNATLFQRCLLNGSDPNELFEGPADRPLTPLFILLAKHDNRMLNILLSQPALQVQHTYADYSPSDLSTLWSLDETTNQLRQLAATAASPPTRTNPNRIAWVANALFQLASAHDQGTPLGLAYIVEAYKLPVVPPRAIVLADAHTIRSACNHLAEANGRLLTNADLIRVLRSSVKQTAIAARLTRRLAPSANGNLSLQSISPSFMSLHNTLDEATHDQPFVSTSLESAYDFGTQSPTSLHIIDDFASAALHASVSSTASALLQQCPAAFHPAVATLLATPPSHTAGAAVSPCSDGRMHTSLWGHS